MSNYGEWVWIAPLPSDDASMDVPFGAKVLRTDRERTCVAMNDGIEVWVQNKQVLKTMHISSRDGVNNMIMLGDLQEYAILRNLLIRYNKKQIYTYIGSMLVAINPYEVLPIYTNSQIQLYKTDKVFQEGEVSPHIFAIGNNSFQEMRLSKSNQCIVISGESGAGKTESTKLLLQYLASVSGKHSWIEQQIIEANPILEAFGNAKTLRNDNSSRFGKYIDIYFNEASTIIGAKIEQYLLEKSRIVLKNTGERNYHIFYLLLAGLSKEEKRVLELEDASKYTYLTGGDNGGRAEAKHDINEFMNIRSAMKILSFSEEQIMDIFRLLAAILHFGNLKYKATVVQNIDTAEINDPVNIHRIANLLGVQKINLIDALVKKTFFAHGERVITNLSKEQAVEARDAFVKGIYGKIFVMIVQKINETIYKVAKKKTSIGILDIFGFENFTSNSFEQLCINFANENLQQFFVKHIFKMEQEEYSKEGINWHSIEFVDNQNILDMIGFQPMNIMALIDEETKFPKGTDNTLLAKLHSNHQNKSVYIKPKYDNALHFGIQHFAGAVFYDPNGFLEKNRDSFNQDLKELIMQSSNKFLIELFSTDDSLDTSKKSVTLSLQFRNSLETLMKTLLACHPFFIRCIKPNEEKKPNILDRSLCIRQLRYSGMMETAKIRQAGFAIRYTYHDFVERYRFLDTNITKKTEARSAATSICNKFLSASPNYAFGHSKIFLKNTHDTILEQTRAAIFIKSVRIIQRGFRRILFKRALRRYREAAVVLQKHWRARGYRSRFLKMRSGFRRLQAVIQQRNQRYVYTQHLIMIVGLQATCRGYLTRKNLSGKIRDKSDKMTELLNIRIQEERQLKKAGNPHWQEIAKSHFLNNVTILHRELNITKEQEESRKIQNSLEEDNQVVDDVFGFLQDIQGLPKTPKMHNKSVRHSSFNEQAALSKAEGFSEDLSEFTFQKFAATYFMSNVSYHYSKRLLRTSLLDLPTPEDEISAQALWITILRFMGDLSEAKYDGPDNESGFNKKQSVMKTLTSTIGRSFQNSQLYKDEILGLQSDKKLIHRTLTKKNKLSAEVRSMIENSNGIQHYQDWLATRSSKLEKLHFIIGHGILRTQALRDEIFCQICKQLTKNPQSTSYAMGWILLSLCAGCFAPSERFEKYLRQFFRNGPEVYGLYCEEVLDRTLQNGTRKQPPSYLELHATKNKTPVTVEIILTDGSVELVVIDSASTSEEVCIQLARKIGLRDLLGFSLFISVADKVLSLGCEKLHIMDAISNCEQYAKENGINERTISWKLFIQKEMFVPWHNPADDLVATNLIFHQIARGVNNGDYYCKSENDVAMLVALQYFVAFGINFDLPKLKEMLPELLPVQLYREETLEKWEKLIEMAFRKSRCVKNNLEDKVAKEDIVFYAKITWPLKFSRFFEVARVENKVTSTEVLILAVNWIGIYLIDNQEQILMELPYTDIFNIYHDSDEDLLDGFTIETVTKESFKFKSLDAVTIFKLCDYLLHQLKKRSIYVVASQDFYKPDGGEGSEVYLKLSKGDLVELEPGTNGDTLLQSNSTWAFGSLNGTRGYFPIDMVYILPCVDKPEKDALELFKKENVKTKKQQLNKYNTLQRQKMHNLRKYASEHFRPNIELKNFGTINTLRKQHGNLYGHSREPLKAPLLMKLHGHNNKFEKALEIFVLIMKYMGDIPQGRVPINTDDIFCAPLEDEALRDEFFCQLMKQMTENTLSNSEERGWDLMWLACGIMIPSSILLKELQEFLKTRPHPIAAECLLRLQKTIRAGNRKYPPYIVEVETIRSRTVKTYHKVYFPDDTDEAFQIESSTKARDLMDTIVKSFKLKSGEGFSLFVKIVDKVISVPEEYFIFDFIYELVDWIKNTYPTRNNEQHIQCQYQLFFLKKLWLNFVPARDKQADEIFHFYQEVPKYMNGYYKISKQEAAQMAALIFRSNNGSDRKQLQQPGIINKLIPEDLIDSQKIDDWKKQIISAYNSQIELNESDSKIEFLKKLQNQAMFGSTFFVVKQKTTNNYDDTILVAINRNGFHIIDVMKKITLKSYDFSELNFWSSGNNYFQINFGNMMGGSKLLCETQQGYKMDDLLSSYIKYCNSKN